MNKTFDKFALCVPVRRELMLFVILFGLAVFLRFNHLGADSPHRISFSLGIETDPPQYTLFARDAVLTGDWNPQQDYRHITYLYSLVSGTGWLVYKLFGFGVYQTNLAAVILSLLSILLFYFIVRKSLGNGVALLALLFIGANYLGIFFGRRPFLENGMNCLFIMGLFFLTYMEKRTLGHFLFGVFFAGAVVFGKIIGVAFMGVPLVYYSYRLFYLKDRKAVGHMTAMALGFLGVFITWFMVIFTPHHEQVTGYVDEQALGLYGMPEGFQSFGKFVWKFLAFGKKSEFFDRMPALSIGSLILIVILSGRLFTRNRDTKTPRFRNTIFIAVAAWLVSTYLFQMPWNYQPARYQTAMIFPFGMLAASLIAYLHNLGSKFNALNRSILFNIILFVSLLLVTYQLVANLILKMGFEFYFREHIPYILAFIVPVSVAYFVLARIKRVYEIDLPATLRYSGILLMLFVFLFYQGKNYLAGTDTVLYTTRQASRDLGTILSPGAVISGPYGPALAQENNLGCVIHIFGTSRPDPELFRKYPVTHLVVERSNEEAAREFYPEIMERAKAITHYYVNCRKLTVYRIAYFSGNPKAANYFPSNYEKAVLFYRLSMPDSADFYLNRFQRMNPDNASGNILTGYYAQLRGDYDRAIKFFERAVEFSPTDFNLHYLLGQAYIARAKDIGDDSLHRLGEQEMDMATRLDLGYHTFDEYINGSMKENSLGKNDFQN